MKRVTIFIFCSDVLVEEIVKTLGIIVDGNLMLKCFHCKLHVVLDSGSDTGQNAITTVFANLVILTITKISYRITESYEFSSLSEEEFDKLVFVIVNIESEIILLILGKFLFTHVKTVTSEVLEDIDDLVTAEIFADEVHGFQFLSWLVFCCSCDHIIAEI